MPVTVSLQSNPTVSNAGTKEADATIINSGETSGTVIYEIQHRNTRESLIIDNRITVANYPQVVSITSAQLQIILPFRTKFRARVKQYAGDWGDWVNFTTRDKRYQSPDAITQLTDDTDNTATAKRNRRIVVTNNAKATVVNTTAGATVTNTDYGYNGTTNIQYTRRGATVTTDNFYA